MGRYYILCGCNITFVGCTDGSLSLTVQVLLNFSFGSFLLRGDLFIYFYHDLGFPLRGSLFLCPGVSEFCACHPHPPLPTEHQCPVPSHPRPGQLPARLHPGRTERAHRVSLGQHRTLPSPHSLPRPPHPSPSTLSPVSHAP